MPMLAVHKLNKFQKMLLNLNQKPLLNQRLLHATKNKTKNYHKALKKLIKNI